ncbi:MAG TPA: hypothetical protein PKD63_02525 [Solirubrobacteraceae bacterium]|nr:hypothetical protein [Solirubrobacteraceae bacterium]
MRRATLAWVIGSMAVALAGAAPAGAAVQVGSSGWLWGNPLPQGNTVNALSFAGATGYAVGQFGTILATGDGGSTWTGVQSGTFTNLTEVQAIDANSMFAGGGCVGRRSDDGGATGVRVAFTPVESSCSQDLVAAWWVSEVTGYIVLEDGTTLRTDNNGDTFAQKVAVPGTKATGGGAKVNDIRFLDANTGLATTDGGKIYRTTDAANSWTEVDSNQRASKKLLFLDDKKGFAVGAQSLFLATSDGGATWVAKGLTLPGPQNLTDISCPAVTTCVMATATNQLVRTSDGGDTGSLVAPSQAPINTAGFASATRVAALGGGGTTAISDDAGVKFAPVGGSLAGSYSAMVAGPAGVAFAPGQKGALAKTTDFGGTWVRGNVSTPNDVIDVSFPTANDGFALDDAGGLFRTGDGGATWRALDIGTTARPSGVEAPNAQVVVIGGPRGVRRSVDAGDTFTAVKGSISRSQLTDVDAAGSALFAFGSQDVWRSTDKGRTWTTVRKPGKYKKAKNGKQVNRRVVRHADFVSAKNGYLLDANGFLYRTSNGGTSWTTLLATGSDRGYGMAFSSSSRGYLIMDEFGSTEAGFLLRTTDSGKTWTPEFVVSSRINPQGVAAGGGGTDYLLGGASSLLFTKTGGLTGAASTLTITTKTKEFKKAPRTSITVTGKLAPTQGADQVTVSYLKPGGTTWRSQTVKVAGNGAYTTSWKLAKGTNTFVAQWPGNFKNAGRGTTPLTVKVGS